VLTKTRLGRATVGELESLKARIEAELAGREEEWGNKAPAGSDGPLEEHVTPTGSYRWEMVECGHKDRCKRCKSGLRHGPYLYRYYRKHGKQKSEYVKLSESRALGFERPPAPTVVEVSR
jgi:hypothetical protein